MSTSTPQIELTVDGTTYIGVSSREYERFVGLAHLQAPRTLREMQDLMIRRSYARHQGMRVPMTEELGITQPTLRTHLNRLGLAGEDRSWKQSDKMKLAAEAWWESLSGDGRNLISRRVEIELGHRPTILEMYEQSVSGQPLGGNL